MTKEVEKYNMIKWYNPLECSTMLTTGFLDSNQFLRINSNNIEQVISENSCLKTLIKHTSGGMVRFITDSSRLIIKAKLNQTTFSNNFLVNLINNFDLYLSKPGMNNFNYFNVTKGDISSNLIEYELFNNLNELKEVLINFPLFIEVEKLLIGLDEKSILSPPTPFIIDKKIVFYGTSITQGAFASRPGNSYVNMISRLLNVEVINLGFSGNGLGEKSIIDVISQIDKMGMLIIDYDANAGSTGTLFTTLEPMINGVRKNHPTIPIIVVSRIIYCLEPYSKKIKKAINKRRRFQKKIVNESNDSNLYYVDGRKLLPKSPYDCFSDDIHLNDLGFYYISQNLAKLIKSIIINNEREDKNND